MKKVLFVSVGNICRSPLAEAIFRQQVKEANLEEKISVDSAGTDDWHLGERPHQQIHDLLIENDINADELFSREISAEDLSSTDYLVVFDQDLKKELESRVTDAFSGEIIRLMDLVKDEKKKDIIDPYYIGYFDEVYDLVFKGCSELLKYIQTKN